MRHNTTTDDAQLIELFERFLRAHGLWAQWCRFLADAWQVPSTGARGTPTARTQGEGPAARSVEGSCDT